MEILPLLCIFFVSFEGLTKGAVVLPAGPLNAAVGGTVMFNTTLTPTENPFVSITWKIDNRPIITSVSGANKTAPEYEGRITLFISTGSLELRNLALNDSGEYEVAIVTHDASGLSGLIRLEVFERPIPVVTANSTDLVEFNSSVRLSCSSSGSSLSFLWLNGTSEVTASDRVQLTDGNTNLTIVSVTRYDQGPFMCRVSNPVSSANTTIYLNISYGPEDVKLIISSPREYYEEGSDITMTCSAVSRPDALFYWFLNGNKLPDTGQELKLMNIQMNQTGNYSCQAFNEKTLRYETSQSLAVSVQAPVANVLVTANSTDLVEFNSSVRLSCSSSGSSLSFLWLNGSSEVTASDRVQLTDGNSNLTIVSVTRYDNATFSCCVSNPITKPTCGSVDLFVSYGPENIKLTISASQEYEEGSDIAMFCSVKSRPAALFYWFLNGDKLSDTGPELNVIDIQINHSGNYSCQAFNEKTQRYETSQSSVVSVQAVSETSPDVCSPGCIAGIVIACLVVCGAGAGGGYYIYRKKKNAPKNIDRNAATVTGCTGQFSTAHSGNQDVNYADIKFFQNKDGGRVQVGTENDMTSQYAQVRMNSSRPAGSSLPTYDAHVQRAAKRAAPQPTGTQVYAEVRKN